MKSDAILPRFTKVIVTNRSLKTFGRVFDVYSFSYDNRFKTSVKVGGHGLVFTIKKSNIELYKEEVFDLPTCLPLPEPEIEPAPLEYRVASSSNNMLKDVFYTIEAADEAIKAWAKRTNQELTFQILTVVKSYKANREIVLEEV